MEYNYHEPLKYYWVLYSEKTHPYTACTSMHPFQFIHELNTRCNEILAETYYHLENWKLITVEEYNLYQELNNK